MRLLHRGRHGRSIRSRRHDGRGDVLIEDGRIVAVDARRAAATGDAASTTRAAAGSCPASIDMHVHLREPGYEYKETVATGTRGRGRRRLHVPSPAWRTPIR